MVELKPLFNNFNNIDSNSFIIVSSLPLRFILSITNPINSSMFKLTFSFFLQLSIFLSNFFRIKPAFIFQNFNLNNKFTFYI